MFPPYQFDISKFANVGNNEMTIIVSNHFGYDAKDSFSKYLLFEPSGLIGEIKLIEF